MKDDSDKLAGCLIVLLIAGVLILPCGGCVLSWFGGIMPEYSVGERTGELIKVSERGVWFRSYEGQLVLNQFAIGKEGSNLFEFSTLDKDVGKELEKHVGKKVVLSYNQYLIGPIQQSTSYTITGVREIK